MICDLRFAMYDLRRAIYTLTATALGLVVFALAGCDARREAVHVPAPLTEETRAGATVVAEERPADAIVWETCEGAFVPVHTSPVTRARITGTLPQGMQDDTSWADVVVQYEPLHGEVYGGTQALRVVVQKINQGTCLVASHSFPLTNAQWLAVRLAARSGSGMPMTIGLRQRGTPYAHVWKKTIQVRPEWQLFSFLVPPTRMESNAWLLLSLEQEGIIDLDDISVVPVEAPQEERGEYLTRNRLANSSFPSGLMAPWGASNTGFTDDNWQPDTSVTGPTGVAALRMKVPQAYKGKAHVSLNVPFAGVGGKTYTMSIFAKGAQHGQMIHLRMGPPGEKLYETPYASPHGLGTEWRRYAFTFAPPPAGDGYYLASFVFSDDTWIDGVQVEEGELSEFVRSGAVELSLRATVPYGIYYDGAALEAELTALDVAPDTVVSGSVSDVYGAERTIGFGKLQPGAQRKGMVRIDTSGLAPLGTYLVTLQAYGPGGAVRSRRAQLLLHRVRPPRFADRRCPASPFGVHILPVESQATMARALGFKWARLFDTEWVNIAGPGPDQPVRLEGIDRSAAVLRAHNFMVVGILGSVPRWASACPPDARGWTADRFIPRDMRAWESYCRTMAVHYASTVAAWEIWNEPFLRGFFAGAYRDGQFVHGTPEQYLPILRSGAAAVRAGNPNALVIWNRGGEQEMAFDTHCIALGACTHVDMVSYHQYIGALSPDAAVARKAREIRETQPAEARAMRIWNTEGGPGPHDVVNWYTAFPPEQRRAIDVQYGAYVARYYLASIAHGTEKFFVYTHAGFGTWSPCYTLMHGDNTLRPSSLAIANLAWHIEGKGLARHMQIADSVTSHEYTNGTERVVILYSTGATPPRIETLPAGWRVRDLFGNTQHTPVRVTGAPLYLQAPSQDTRDAEQLLAW